MKTEEKADLNLKVKLMLDTPADHQLLINDSLIQEGSDHSSVRLRLFELFSLKKYVTLVQLKKIAQSQAGQEELNFQVQVDTVSQLKMLPLSNHSIIQIHTLKMTQMSKKVKSSNWVMFC